MEVAQILVIAVLVEAIWETIKMGYQNNKICKDRIGAIIISILITINYNVDLFNTLSISQGVTWVGLVSTGIIISRGANFIHDILDRIGG